MSMTDVQFTTTLADESNDNEFKMQPITPLQQGLQQDITTRRNRPKFLYEGALYVYHGMSSKNDAKYWRCEFFNAKNIKCRGRLHTDINDVVIRQIGEHVCNHSAARVEAQRILSGIKRRAMVSNEKPLQIRTQTLQNTPMAVIAAMPSKEATKRMIKRARRGIDMNTLVTPHACPIYKQDDGEHYGNMVYTEVDGQRVECFERNMTYLKDEGMEDKWPRPGGNFGGGLQGDGTSRSSNPHNSMDGYQSSPNNRQFAKGIGGSRQRKKVKEEFMSPPPQPIAILDRTLPHVFINRKTNEFSFSCNIAGYTSEELQVELVGAELVISGNHKQHTIHQSFHATFSRRILLPEGVHKESIQCSVDDKGCLNVIGQLMHVGGKVNVVEQDSGKLKTLGQEIQERMDLQQRQQQQQTSTSSVAGEIDNIISSIDQMIEDSSTKTEKMAQPEYIVVAKSLDEDAERIEVPTDVDGSLVIQTLARAFPGAHGLKYKNPATGAFRALFGAKFFPPADGWENKVFIVVFEQKDQLPEKVQIKKGDQNAKRRKLMVESDDGDSHDSDSDRPPGEKLRNNSSGGEGVKRQIGVSKQKRMMGSVGGNVSSGVEGGANFDNVVNEYVNEMCEEEQVFPNRMVDLLVLGLPFELTDAELKTHFETFGKVVHCEIKAQKGSNTNRGFGFVQMNDLESQRKVLQQKKHYIGGRECTVKNALSSKVFVGRIKEGTTTVELREFFSEEAHKIEPDSTITDVYIPRPFRSFAFVSFSSPIVAKELIKVGQFTMGETQIYVSSAHSTRPHTDNNNIQSYQPPFKSNVQSFFTDWYPRGDTTSSSNIQGQQTPVTLSLYPNHPSMFNAQGYQQHQAPPNQPPPTVFMGGQTNAPPPPPTGVIAPGSQMLNQLETLNLNNIAIRPEVANALQALISAAQTSAISQHPQYPGHLHHTQQQKLSSSSSLSPPPGNNLQSNSTRYIPPRERPTANARRNNNTGNDISGNSTTNSASGWR